MGVMPTYVCTVISTSVMHVLQYVYSLHNYVVNEMNGMDQLYFMRITCDSLH